MNMYMAQPRFGAARARYQSVDLASRIEGASPHALVAILFEELLKSLDAMSAAWARKDYGQRGTRQARALSILHGLESSLDVENGGDIAQSLGAVYREARRLVIASCRESDPEMVTRARTMLAEISSAWDALR
jgi:flagellar protein FliS